ncbi:MAG TPA: hypothetical protein VFC00_03500 [Micromonosporaceae bacterium]|nr:hypothetical protein [Micromonosporaceae bacterium]
MPIQSFTPAELRELFRGNVVVGLAEQAIRAFYVTSRSEAVRVLPLWRHFGELSAREVAAVLARFDDDHVGREDPETGAPLPADVEGFRPHPRDRSES